MLRCCPLLERVVVGCGGRGVAEDVGHVAGEVRPGFDGPLRHRRQVQAGDPLGGGLTELGGELFEALLHVEDGLDREHLVGALQLGETGLDLAEHLRLDTPQLHRVETAHLRSRHEQVTPLARRTSTQRSVIHTNLHDVPS